jgi:predicted regulator of amino acid metabolism with ACT domain
MAGEDIKQENIKQTSFLQSILDTIMHHPTPEKSVNVAAYSVPAEPAVQSDRMSSENLIKMLNTTMSLETIGNSQLTTMNALRDLAEDSYVELVEIRNNTGNTVKALKTTNERLANMNQSFKDFNGK